MDEHTNNIAAIREIMDAAEVRREDVAKALYASGYRYDPYPNGKTKGQLIARIEELDAERDKTRGIATDLLSESKKRHEKDIEDANYHGSRHDATRCMVCIRNAKAEVYLYETSLVKP